MKAANVPLPSWDMQEEAHLTGAWGVFLGHGLRRTCPLFPALGGQTTVGEDLANGG